MRLSFPEPTPGGGRSPSIASGRVKGSMVGSKARPRVKPGRREGRVHLTARAWPGERVLRAKSSREPAGSSPVRLTPSRQAGSESCASQAAKRRRRATGPARSSLKYSLLLDADGVREPEGSAGQLATARGVRATGVLERGTAAVGLPKNQGRSRSLRQQTGGTFGARDNRSASGRKARSRSSPSYLRSRGTDPRWDPTLRREGAAGRARKPQEGKMAEMPGSGTISTKPERIATLAREAPQLAP